MWRPDLNRQVWRAGLDSIVAQGVGTTALWTHLLPNQNHQKITIFIGPSPPPPRLRHLLEQRLPPLLRPLLTRPPLLLLLRGAFLMVLQTPPTPANCGTGLSRFPPSQMRLILKREKAVPMGPAPNHTINLSPRRTLPPDVGEVVEGVTGHDRSRHFRFFFSLHPTNIRLHLSLHTSSS